VVFCDGIIRDGFAPSLLWHNPNIHPFIEYKARRGAASDFANISDLPIAVDDNYGLRDFVYDTAEHMDDKLKRCGYCYCSRLHYAAKYAKEHGYAAFSTTLLASPYQDFDNICKYGYELAKEHGLEFIVRDYRKDFREAMNKARAMGLYMQKYCGCVFSEEERYRKL